MFRDMRTKPLGTRIQTTTMDTQTLASIHDVDFDNFSNETEIWDEQSEEEPKVERVLSRTELLIRDYMQFKAARRIQSAWRGYFYRQRQDLTVWAAITIQRWWRGFYVRHNFFNKIEDMLQRSIIEHYNRAAIKIQALFRGWWVRQTVHDVSSLRRMQRSAAEDLLNCIAFYLHHLQRTYSIPGVYSIRNSHCLSRVEKLLASMNYRFHNDRVRTVMSSRAALAEYQRKRFMLAARYTNVPYAGPNFTGICGPQHDDYVISTKDMDRRMYKVIALYEQSQRDEHAQRVTQSLAEKKRRKQQQEILERQKKHRRDFCGDVIASMRRWKVLGDYKKNINLKALHDPQNMENFLSDVAEIIANQESQTCHCQRVVHDSTFCH
ncbi:uncharacterized protein LOC115634172 [Scaptodrosophila lebanonensis]|uniref:Uncharacterized protein LOC115634172 n=1 Tax=Drosophila lebanonensis TaxID=7225 RepID=A0A6J2UK63_DROLE|nr:uncharacterized protein LOC115634172 [Scaptodrosophila lebanonensis]